MNDIIKKGSQEIANISKDIRTRHMVKFDMRDIAEYSWILTHAFYGRGHYPGMLESEGIRHKKHYSIPILLHDDETWSVPFYRHRECMLEFFTPGIAQGSPERYINPYTFYSLSGEEKERCEEIIHEEFDMKVLKEMDALREVYASYFDLPPKIHGNPGKFVVLFGKDLYKGEDIEKFRERMTKRKLTPAVEIYV